MRAPWYNTSMTTMQIIKAQYVCGAAYFNQLPRARGDEYCVMGRSNVGKSSFINHVFGDRSLARVSKQPGKTALANVYALSDGATWVDLPGYGFADAPKGERVRWDGLIEEYCSRRSCLKGCIWLLDARHAGLPADILAHEWFAARGIRAFPVLTKCDKLSNLQVADQTKAFLQVFGFPEDPVRFTIKETGCLDEFWRRFKRWQKGET
jgi:GTP-binding protein